MPAVQFGHRPEEDPLQIEHHTSQASARRTSSPVMQGCVYLGEKPTIHEVCQDLARSYQWYRRTRGALDPAVKEATVSVSGLERPLQRPD